MPATPRLDTQPWPAGRCHWGLCNILGGQDNRWPPNSYLKCAVFLYSRFSSCGFFSLTSTILLWTAWIKMTSGSFLSLSCLYTFIYTAIKIGKSGSASHTCEPHHHTGLHPSPEIFQKSTAVGLPSSSLSCQFVLHTVARLSPTTSPCPTALDDPNPPPCLASLSPNTHTPPWLTVLAVLPGLYLGCFLSSEGMATFYFERISSSAITSISKSDGAFLLHL